MPSPQLKYMAKRVKAYDKLFFPISQKIGKVRDKKGFKLYWKRKSRRVGRPNIDWELIKLIRRMQKENPTWTAQRIQGELVKLGLDVSDNTVAKYMRKSKEQDHRKPFFSKITGSFCRASER